MHGAIVGAGGILTLSFSFTLRVMFIFYAITQHSLEA
jgi:hypothetical protein